MFFFLKSDLRLPPFLEKLDGRKSHFDTIFNTNFEAKVLIPATMLHIIINFTVKHMYAPSLVGH